MTASVSALPRTSVCVFVHETCVCMFACVTVQALQMFASGQAVSVSVRVGS